MMEEYTAAVPATIAWINQLKKIILSGSNVKPLIYNHEKEMTMPCLTKEIVGSQMVIDMNYPVIVIPERKLSYKFMAAESLWILEGSNNLEEIAKYNSIMRKFSDDGETLFGAYGPKFVDQLPYVLEALTDDYFTRRAVINIWREKPPKSKDIPCTLSVQFLVRNRGDGCYLDIVVNMRSSDVWLGVPYDIFAFSMMGYKVLNELMSLESNPWLGIGHLYLNMGSSHMYTGKLDGQQNNLLGAVECMSSETRNDLGPVAPWSYISTEKGYKLFIKQIRRACRIGLQGDYMFAIVE